MIIIKNESSQNQHEKYNISLISLGAHEKQSSIKFGEVKAFKITNSLATFKTF